MTANRSTIHRSVVVASTLLVSAAGLVACNSEQTSPTATRTVTANLNHLEHAASRHLAEVRAEQASALNPREHLAHQSTDGRSQASSACSAALAQAWERLGHFSDGYERFLLTQPPCA